MWAGKVDGELATRTLQPQSAGLTDRIWYGAGSVASAQWGARRGLHLLTSNVARSHDGDLDFSRNMARVIDGYLDAHPDPAAARISSGLVIIPTDSATAAQKKKYRAYRSARDQRVGNAYGVKANVFQPDYLGTAEQLVELLYADLSFALATEVAFALPFPFDEDDDAQRLDDIRFLVAPALGWKPAAAVAR